MRIPVALSRAVRLLNHGPVTLVSAIHEGRSNVMAAQWVMPLDFDPPKVALVLAAGSFTRLLAERSGECAINLPIVAQAGLVLAAGTLSGHDGDKLADLGITTFSGEFVKAPLVDGCAAWLECTLSPEPDLAARHDLFVAEIRAASADAALFDGRTWTFPDEARRTLHHLAGPTFFSTGTPFAAPRHESSSPGAAKIRP